jgi:hypothetical protein
MPFSLWPKRKRVGTVPYQMHHGDVFFPGADSMVFDWQWKLPMQTIQGQGTIAGPGGCIGGTGPVCGVFTGPTRPSVWQNPQAYIVGNAYIVAGVGGPLAGEIFTQPLLTQNGQ